MPDEPILPGAPVVGGTTAPAGAEGGAYLPGSAHAASATSASLPPLPHAPEGSERAVALPVEHATEPTETRAARIARVVADGGLRELPSTWGDPVRDWQSIRSEDPFEALYLDYRQAARITGEMLATHHRLIRAFWAQKEEVMSRGAGTARDRVLREYGVDVPRFLRRADECCALLSVDGGIIAQAARRHQLRRAEGERLLARAARASLADGELSRDESEILFEEGAQAGLTDEEVAEYLLRQLGERGFNPVGTPSTESLAARVRSVDWRTPQRAASAVSAFNFGKGALVRSVDELIDHCDRYPREALEYLFAGYFEPWLATSLREGHLARLANEAARTQDTHREKVLETFVRALSAHVGRPAIPVVRADPSQVNLGSVPLGGERMVRVQIVREQRPIAWGAVRLEGNVGALIVIGAFAPDADGVILSLASAAMTPGAYAGRLVIEPEEGEAIAVPIEYQILPLRLTADPPALRLGTILYGASRTQRVRVTTSPAGGRLVGALGLSPPTPGVSVSGDITGAEVDAEITVATRSLRASTSHQTSLRVLTNAGTIEIPVSFSVGLARSLVLGWTVGFALIGATLLGGFRRLAGEIELLRDWTLTYGALERQPSLLMAAGTVAVVVLLGRTVIGRLRRRFTRTSTPS